MNQEIALHVIVGCTKTTLLRNLGKFLFSIRYHGHGNTVQGRLEESQME
jgi:hypothetical protein